MSDEHTRSDPASSLSESTPFHRFLQRWLDQASPALVEAARLAALPHTFTISLLSLLRNDNTATATIVAMLIEVSLLTEIEPDNYTVYASLRGQLLLRWQTEDPETFRQACAQIVESMLDPSSDSEIDPVEYVYLQLGADDSRGIDLLRTALEQAWNRGRLGLAERLLAYANEQIPILGTEAQAWLVYFQAQQDLVYRNLDRSEARLRMLLDHEQPLQLRVQALMTLGNLLIEQQRWTEAQDRYHDALLLYLDLGDRLGAALCLENQGLDHLRLATSLGGLPQEWGIRQPNRGQWLHTICHAPFLLYRSLSRRFEFLPNLYFGTNYQNWIIVRLLYTAIECLEKAVDQLSPISEGADHSHAEVLTDIQIRLADLYHRMDRWSTATRLFRHLLTVPIVQESKHRQALLHLAQGRASLGQSDILTARTLLAKAREFFARYGDDQALATILRLQGDLEARDNRLEAAVALYIESHEHAMAIDDLLMATHIWSELADLGRHASFSAGTLSSIETLGQTMDRRAYIARFPGSMLQSFRGLAMYIAAPLAYLLVAGPLKAWVSIPFIVFDVLLLNRIPFAASPFADLAGGIIVFVGILLGILWLHELFYVISGWFFIRYLPLHTLSQYSPLYVLTFPKGIVLRNYENTLGDLSLSPAARFTRLQKLFGHRSPERRAEGDGDRIDLKPSLIEIPWEAVTEYVTIDRCLWRTPIALFSVLLLTSEAVTVAVPGVLYHYQQLQTEILDRLQRTGHQIRQQRLGFSVFKSRWALVALAITIVLATIILPDWLNRACKDANLQSILLRAGNYTYLIDGNGDVQSLQNVQRPGLLNTVGSFDVSGTGADLSTDGRHLYLIDTAVGLLRVIDVSSPEFPREIGSIPTSKQTTTLAIDEGFVYIADRSGGLQIVDIRDPTAPVSYRSNSKFGEVFDLAVAYKRAYIANGSEGLRVVDVTNPVDPIEVGFFATDARAVAVSGHYVYVAGTNGFQVVDVANLENIKEVGFSADVTEAIMLDKEGSHLFLASSDRSLWVFNVYNPRNPTLVHTHTAPGPINDLTVALSYAFVVTDNAGLFVIDFLTPCGEVHEIPNSIGVEKVQKIALIKPYPLLITSIIYELLRWGLLIFPLISIAHLIYKRILERRLLRDRFRFDITADLSIGIVFLLFLYWTVNTIYRHTY